MKNISALIRSAGAWVEGFARKRSALWALFAVAFVESSILPLPPDILLIALSVSNPAGSFVYAAICVAGSVIGSFLGYAIGGTLFQTIGLNLLEFYGVSGEFQSVLNWFREYAWQTILIAGFVPIPYHVVTMAAGFNQAIDPLTFGVASLVGRSLRFFAVGALLFFFAQRMKDTLATSVSHLSLALGVLLVSAFVLVQWIF